MLSQGRDAASPRDAADRERGFERSLRRDALRKRVMMKLVPTPDQVGAWARTFVCTCLCVCCMYMCCCVRVWARVRTPTRLLRWRP